MKVMRGRKTHMKHLYLAIGMVIPAMLLSHVSYAAGTGAGTSIANTASANYTVGTTPITKPSNTTTTTVAQITAVSVVATNTPLVSPGDAGQAISFLVTNTGNGADTFNLSSNSVVAGDNFDPTADTIYEDTNGNGIYDVLTDTAVVAVTATLAADAYATFFVVNTIPAGVVDTYTGDTQLIAQSQTANSTHGVAGFVVVAGGVGGVDALVGAGLGEATGSGTYTVSNITTVPGNPGPGPFIPGGIPPTYNPGEYMKTAVITDPYGGVSSIPGATIDYTLIFSVLGSATATATSLTDDIPANTTFVSGSITFDNDGAAGAVAVGVPNGSVQGGTTAFAAGAGANAKGIVSVFLGNMTSVSPIQVVTFQVTID